VTDWHIVITEEKGTPMPPLDDIKPVGWRAKIGVIVPPSNTVNEAEFNRVAPDGVSFHFTRSPLHTQPETDDFKQMLEDLQTAMSDLNACMVDYATYACTAGSMACPPQLLLKTMTDNGRLPANSTALAIIEALRALGANRIVMASPYTPETNDHEQKYLENHNIKVLGSVGLSLNTSLEKIQEISRIPPTRVFEHARAADQEDAEALLICCTDFNTFDAIEPLEQALGKPVISSNSATLWHCLRGAGISDPIYGLGKLLRYH